MFKRFTFASRRRVVIHPNDNIKLEHRLSKVLASLDHFIVRLTLLGIAIYILSYGLFNSGGVKFGEFNWWYVSIIIPIWLTDGMKGLIEALMPSSYRTSKEDLSKVTVIIPSKDGGPHLEETVKNILERFSADNIIVISNGSTDNSVEIAKSAKVKCIDIQDAVGKVRAINYGLEHVTTPYVLLIDDDTLIGKAKIPTGLLEKGYDAVSFRVLVHISTWLTKIQMYEYRKSTDLGKRYHNRKATVQNIFGAMGLFKLSELKRQVNHHTLEFSGEDLQRTLLLHLLNDNKGVVLTDSVVYTHPPTKLTSLFNQRTLGWFPGMYVNFMNYIRLLFAKHVSMPLRIDAFYNGILVMTFDILRLLTLPVLIFYPWHFIIMYLIYFCLESISYYKSKSDEPFWVVAVYPLYGLFNFISRICALTVFAYRRIVSSVARSVFFDDYRHAPHITKIITILFIALAFETSLLLYLSMGIIDFFTLTK